MLVKANNSGLHKGKSFAYKVIRAYSDVWREEEQEWRKYCFKKKSFNRVTNQTIYC